MRLAIKSLLREGNIARSIHIPKTLQSSILGTCQDLSDPAAYPKLSKRNAQGLVKVGPQRSTKLLRVALQERSIFVLMSLLDRA
jgi:hypothetical protein